MSFFAAFVMKLSQILTMDLSRPWTAFEESSMDARPVLTGIDDANLCWSSSSYGDDLQTVEPTFNVDGTPMCAGIDMHGNPYGVTSNWDSHSCNSHDTYENTSSNDSWDNNSWNNHDW